jgi:hypothetical protein
MTFDGVPRSGDEHDVRLRRHVATMARVSVAAALAVPLAGLLMVATGVERSEPPAAADLSTPPGTSLAPIPTPARVLLSASGTRSSPVVWRSAPAASRTKSAVLIAYETYVGTTVRLGEEPDPEDVALAQIALDPQLGRLRRALAADAVAGQSRRGRVTAGARVEGVRGGMAVVVGCLDLAAQHRYGPDDRPVRNSRAGLSVSRAWMRLEGGRWKVYTTRVLPASRCHR